MCNLGIGIHFFWSYLSIKIKSQKVSKYIMQSYEINVCFCNVKLHILKDTMCHEYHDVPN